MTEEIPVEGWALREALIETAPDNLRHDLAAAREALERANDVRRFTPTWMGDGGDLGADQEASADVARCENQIKVCCAALVKELFGKLADGRLFAEASSSTPKAKPERIAKQAWPYIRVIQWDPSLVEAPGEDGNPVSLFNIRVFRSIASEQSSSSVKAENECFRWITREIVPLQKEDRLGRDEYLPIALAKFGGLKARAFYRAWSRARDKCSDLGSPGPRNRSTRNRRTK